jgi:hypothetical protein
LKIKRWQEWQEFYYKALQLHIVMCHHAVS